MKTLAQLDNLQSLGSSLQEKLCAAFPEIVYFQVNCVLENGMLMVEIEHPEDNIPAPELLLPAMEEALANLDVDMPLPVNLYLKIPGVEHPYSLYSFTLPPLDKRSSRSKVKSTIFSPTASSTKSGREEPVDALRNSERVKPRFDFKPIAIALGSIVGLGVFGLTVYGLTRPCVIGGCQAITVAEELQQKSKEQQAASQSEADLAKAKEPLETAINRLKTIPNWSGSYSQAQSLQNNYRSQINWLESARLGLSQIGQATAKSQNPPLTVTQWRETEQLWQASINNLQQIPAQSNAYPLAQAKLKQSRNNLVAAKTQIGIAQKAEDVLAKGQEKARVAKALQGIAQTVPEWQKAKLGWQSAIAELGKVETGTAARKSAAKTLADAQKQLKISSDRLSQEELSSANYNSAQKFAQNAEDFQVADQWLRAVNSWDRAINVAQQVPNNTFYYAKTQPLITKYKGALTEARSQLTLANQRRDRAQKALQKLCSTKPPICSFKLEEDTIKVNLTPVYTQAVKQASLNAKKKGDYNTQAAIVDRVLALGETLNTVSTNFRLRLELYGDNGKIIQVYNPGR